MRAKSKRHRLRFFFDKKCIYFAAIPYELPKAVDMAASNQDPLETKRSLDWGNQKCPFLKWDVQNMFSGV